MLKLYGDTCWTKKNWTLGCLIHNSSITATTDHTKGVLEGHKKPFNDCTLWFPTIYRIYFDCKILNSWLRNGGRTLVSCVLTTLGYLTDVHALLCCHEAQHREHHEACKEAGSTVDNSQYECIPAGKCEEKKGEWEGEQSLVLWARTRTEPYQYTVTWALCELLKRVTGSTNDKEWKGSSN